MAPNRLARHRPSAISVKRAVKRYREKGVSGFYEEPKRRGSAVLTEAVLKQAQGLLDEGLETSEVAEELAVKEARSGIFQRGTINSFSEYTLELEVRPLGRATDNFERNNKKVFKFRTGIGLVRATLHR